MMTDEEYLATPKRQGSPFTFLKNGETEFLPGEGTRLSYGSRTADMLEVEGVPGGFFKGGDTVTVKYGNTTIFTGLLTSAASTASRGDTYSQTAVFTGPWERMARVVCRQMWHVANGYKESSRLILNQAQNGDAQSINVAVREILTGMNNSAPAACGYQVGTVSVGSVTLPFDETRDITIADAVKRELRLFPAAVTRFDYSTTPPTLNALAANRYAAVPSYITEGSFTVISEELNSNPITAVDLEIEATSEVEGVQYRNITHQTARIAGSSAEAGSPDCLYATLQIAGAAQSSVKQSFTAKVEDPPTSPNDAVWWKNKHPRLKNVPLAAIAITGGARSGAATAADYPRIAKNTVGEIEAAGLKARVETWSCTCKITTTDDVEEEIYLQLQFVMTNAQNRTYTWVAESSATSGETVPADLAQRVLAARRDAWRGITATMRLPATAAAFPQIGDAYHRCILQNFTIDCTTLLMEMHFGAPEYISPDDMASLMTNFRNKRRTTCAASRVSGKIADDSESELEDSGIPPLSSTEFEPGVKAKTTFKSVAGGNSTGSMVVDATGASPRQQMNAVSNAKIDLNTADLPGNDVIKIRTLRVKGANGLTYLIHIPMCRDVELDLKGGNINISGGGAGGDTPGGDPDPEPVPLPEPSGNGGDSGMFHWDEATGTMGPGGVMVGRRWVSATGTGSKGNGTYYVKVTFTSGGGATAAVVDAAVTTTDTVCCIPIYTISGGKISTDLRGAFVVPAWE